jgi:bifunctional DNA-binding transcriptional regulator/antitoxin component of YhaV-PrlF toxin-antitoxin module
MTKETKNPDIMLPEAACELCGFTGEERLQLHASEDTLIILKEKMTAMELVHAIDALGEIASNLTVHLAKACGFCDNCGDEDPGLCEDCAAKASAEQRKNAGRGPVEWVKDCDLCLELLEAGQVIRLPERLLEEAGIPKGSKLEAYADKDSGEITVARAEGQYDIGDVPPELRAVLARSGVCLAELDDLISQEEIVYGNK